MLRLMREREESASWPTRWARPPGPAALARGPSGPRPDAPGFGACITGPTRASPAGTTSPLRSRRRRWRSGLSRRAVPIRPLRTDKYPTDARRPAYSVLERSATLAALGVADSPLAGNSCATMLREAGACVGCSSPGGAGFIGANFVRYWLGRHPEDRGRGARRPDLRRQPGQPRAGPDAPRLHASCTATSRRRGLAEELLRDARDRRRSCTSPPSRTSTARSPAPTPSSRPTSSAPTSCSRRRAGSAAPGSGFHHVSTDEVYGSLDPDAPPFTETRRYAPNSPYAASKAALRPPGARLPSHLRPPGDHQQLLEQLRALPVPREADPADAGERARRQAAPGLRRRPQRARLAVRRGPLPGGRAGAAAWPRRRNLQRGRLERAHQPRRRPPPLPPGRRRVRGRRRTGRALSPRPAPPGGKTPAHCSPS